MDALTFVNTFNNNSGVSLPPTVKLQNLLIGYEYDLQDLKRIVTRYGISLVAILFDDLSNSTFQVYLPFSYVNRFTDKDMQVVKKNNFKFVCNGVGNDGKTHNLSIRYSGGDNRV